MGREFSLSEMRSGKSVCLLGNTVREDLFGDSDPVGRRIRVDKVSCDVIGVLATKGKSTFGSDQDARLLGPAPIVEASSPLPSATLVGLWPFVLAAGAAAGVYVYTKRGRGDGFAEPAGIESVARLTLGGANLLHVLDVEDRSGRVRVL